MSSGRGRAATEEARTVCPHCGAATNDGANYCLHCGTEIDPQNDGSDSTSTTWYYGIYGGMVVVTASVFLLATLSQVTSAGGVMVIGVIAGEALLAASIHYDAQDVAETTSWRPRRQAWIVGALVPVVNLVVGTAYLTRRRKHTREKPGGRDRGPTSPRSPQPRDGPRAEPDSPGPGSATDATTRPAPTGNPPQRESDTGESGPATTDVTTGTADQGTAPATGQAPDQGGTPPRDSQSGSGRADNDLETPPETDEDGSITWPAVEQRRDQAFSALFGYSVLVLIRLTGISALLFAPHAENPFFATSLHSAGVFLFYDGFIFVLIALLSSAYLTARGYSMIDDAMAAPDSLGLLDKLATIALSGSSLIILVGVLAGVTG